jgi:D-threo-aldose 1-dehydrogenase
MILSAKYQRPFGRIGLRLPPLWFGACALGDARHMLPDQTKRGLVAEWFKHVAPPVVIDVGGDDACRRDALVFLSHALTRLGIAPEEVLICIRLGEPSADPDAYNGDALVDLWYEDCRLLGSYAPKLVLLERPDRFVAAVTESGERCRLMGIVQKAVGALSKLKNESDIVGIGASIRDVSIAEQLLAVTELDWLKLVGGCSVMAHPPEVVAMLRDCERQQVPVVAADVFESGFLVGGDMLDSRPFDPHHPDNDRLAKWRKSFTALCHGHGITPAHAAMQFSWSLPAVVAVSLNSARPERVAENAASACTSVPNAFWWSMKEESLVGEDFPLPQ